MKKILGDPAYCTGRHCIQADVEDCNSRAHNYTFGKGFFVQCTYFCEFLQLGVFFYTGKSD